MLSFKVQVKVNRGIATLYGNVDNAEAKQAAVQDARNTVGVLRVENRIDVRPEKKLTSAEIKGRILGAIARDPLLETYEVYVRVTNGIATLHGSVDSAFERSWAERVASKVQGVKYVDNRLTVERNDRLPYKPYAYDPYPYTYSWYWPDHLYAFKTDDQLKEDIQDELWWSPFVDEEQVKVEVTNGTAHLMGTVDSWREFEAAADNAYEAGAVAVDNDLLIASQ